MDYEYSDPIEKFKQPPQINQQNISFGGIDPRSINNTGNQSNGMNKEHFQAQQKAQQQAQQQQQQAQLQAQQQAQQQAQLQAQQIYQQQQIQKEMFEKEKLSNNINKENSKTETFSMIKEKFNCINLSTIVQEVLIISILYIIASNSIYKTYLAKLIPIINLENNELNPFGLVLTGLLISIIFIVIRLFI